MERSKSSSYRELPRFVKRYTGREAAREELMDNLRSGVNTVVMGVEGIGKSALLSSVLTAEYCRRMADEEHILIRQVSYPNSLATEEIFCFFAESVRDAAEVLEECGKKALYEDIKNKAREYREDSMPQGYFQKICQYIRGKGYCVVLAIDRFECFTSSGHVLAEHHDVMRNVLVENNLCFVVATDYDFDRDALPQNASGSLLLQLFAGHEIPLKGLGREECGAFLRGISGRENDFTPEELGKLSRLTGGIPTLLCRAAYYALQQREAGRDVSWRDVKESVLRDYGELMERWLGVLTPPEVKLLGELAGQIDEAVPIPTDLRDGAAPLLLKRGLIVDLGDNCYDFNSRLLQEYCIRYSPTPRLPQDLPTLKPVTAPSPQPGSAPTIVINHYEDKSTRVYNEGGVMEAGAVQIQSLSVSEWLGRLDRGEEFQKALTTQLVERLSEYRRELGATPGLPEAVQEDVQEESRDKAFSQAGSDFLADLGMDEDQEQFNISAQEQETLDERFSQARDRCHRNLSDKLLALMSERCRLYLKMSVVVEDALSILGSEIMSDCSPHLVLYGKALEQALRDNLFQLFQREERLSSYDTYAKCEDRASANSFRNKQVSKTFIGNFVCLIRDQSAYLGRLCTEREVRTPEERVLSEEEWLNWWRTLENRIDRARKIRNLADHPDDRRLPTADDLNAMCEVLLGTEEGPGILEQTTVGRELFSRLYPSEGHVSEET